MVAFSGLRTRGVGRSIPVAFIEEIYVSPAWRGKGVGHCLLDKMVLTGDFDRRGRVGCVVRGAAQQDAARHLYRKMGMRSKPARKHLVDASARPVELRPLHACGQVHETDASEYYYEGSAVDAAVAAGPRFGMGSNNDHGFKIDIRPSPADTFVQENRAFMRQLRRCHDPRHGGDGGNPYEVLAAAEKVYVAYACA